MCPGELCMAMGRLGIRCGIWQRFREGGNIGGRSRGRVLDRGRATGPGVDGFVASIE